MMQRATRKKVQVHMMKNGDLGMRSTVDVQLFRESLSEKVIVELTNDEKKLILSQKDKYMKKSWSGEELSS